jgi:hypothetical protein
VSGIGKGGVVHKDTAKWLLTFVPIPTFLALAIGLGTRFTAITQVGIIDWTCQFPVPAVAVALTAIATVLIIGACCWVLLAGPTSLATLKEKPNWWSDAFSQHGVGEPYFKSSDRYNEADEVRAEGKATDAQISALADTMQRIIALSEDLTTRSRFRCFMWIFGSCALVIVIGLSTATATLPTTPDAVTKPTKVSILVPPGTEPRLAADFAAAGCTCFHDTTAIAVSGLWNNPTLRLIGKGCRTGTWTPATDLNAVITSAGG